MISTYTEIVEFAYFTLIPILSYISWLASAVCLFVAARD
jgi:hypothetical protein